MQKTIQEPHVDSVSVLEAIECKAGYTAYIIEVVGNTRFLLNTPYQENVSYKIKARYSDMLEFNSTVTQLLLPFGKQLFDFPPKKFINSHTTEFLEQRRTQLQTYFSQLISTHKSDIQKQLIEFCAPTKANIIICGSHNSMKSEFISTLAKLVKNKIIADSRFRSMPTKNGSITLSEEPDIVPLVSSISVTTLTTPFISLIGGSKCNYPFDYLLDDFMYRVDIDEQSIDESYSNAHLPNLLSRWGANKCYVMIAANLSNQKSLAKSIDILDAYSHMCAKQKPVFVVLGIYDDSKPVCDGAHKLLMSKVLKSACTAYVDVNMRNGDGMIKSMNLLLRAVDKMSL
jgi:PX domain